MSEASAALGVDRERQREKGGIAVHAGLRVVSTIVKSQLGIHFAYPPLHPAAGKLAFDVSKYRSSHNPRLLAGVLACSLPEFWGNRNS